MKKIVIDNSGSYEHLKVSTCQDPSPKDGEVLIECRACGVNFADCCVRMGVYQPAKEFVGWPITPGFEVAGIVKEIGPNVSRFSVGDRVIAVTLFGGYTSHLCLSEDQVFSLPNGMNFEQGAAVPTIFLTAYYAMHELAHPHPEQTLLIHSAAGGVGSSLVQLGKLAQCRVVGVVGAPHKVGFVQELGADAVIDKATKNLWSEAKALAPKGYDVVFDANGPETLLKSYQHLGVGGKLIVYGFHTMLTKGRGKPNWIKVIWDYLWMPRFNPLSMTTDNKSIMAFNLAYQTSQPKVLQEGMNHLLQWFQEGKLKVPSIQTFPLEEVSRAHRALESGQTVGKLVLLP